MELDARRGKVIFGNVLQSTVEEIKGTRNNADSSIVLGLYRPSCRRLTPAYHHAFLLQFP